METGSLGRITDSLHEQKVTIYETDKLTDRFLAEDTSTVRCFQRTS